jgi:DNA-directed RNA polymerase specialized sigma24 family protein
MERQLGAEPDGGVGLATDGPLPIEQLARQEDMDWLNQALEQLDVYERQLVQLRFFDDLPFDAIAAQLGTKPATLRKQVPRTIQKLRGGILLLKRMQQERFLPLQQQAICLWYFQACSQDRIAARLHIPKNAVTKWIQDIKRSFPAATGDQP